MATVKNPDLIPIPQPPDYHPLTTVASPEHDGLHFWQFMIAGSVAGSFEHMAMFPVDTVKTRMQALGPCPVRPLGLQQALGTILRTEGPRVLYRGIGAMGLGAGPAHAVYFSVYESCKETFSRGNPNNPMAHASAGVCATVASDAVFTPMDMVKQRLQLGSSPYKGVYDCVKTVFREEGFRAFYASYGTTVLMNAPFTAVHFATYEATKRGLSEVSPEIVSDERLVVHATAGAVAGALAAVVTTPLDVVKTQLQCQGVCGCDKFANGSIRDVIETIIRKDGYRGLMRGWVPRMLFHAPAAAICWSTYEAESGGGSDSDANADDSPEYYHPISGGEDASDSDDAASQFYRLPNGYSNGVVNGVSSLDLSDDDEIKRSEEEEAADAAIRRAMREDESRRSAPLTAENATRVVEAMRGVTFSGAPPPWAGRVPEEQWINQIMRLREPQTIRSSDGN